MADTDEFPQANNILNVGKAVLAVAGGRHSDIEIERYLKMHSGGRQGRYHRKAAELLGLISSHANNAKLTALGTEFSILNTDIERIDYLARCIVEAPVFRDALELVDQQNPTSDKMRQWFVDSYDGAHATAVRRYSTFLNYVKRADLVSEKGGHLQLKRFAVGLLPHQNINAAQAQPTYQIGNVPNAPNTMRGQTIAYEVDVQKHEQAKMSHWKLVNAKAAQLKAKNFQVATLGPIDLVARDQNAVTFYEMKSIANDGLNFQAQIRKAVSQLYEYRFLALEANAKLCIVTNASVPQQLNWLQEYLAGDRKIGFEWTTNFIQFDSDVSTRGLLGGFA